MNLIKFLKRCIEKASAISSPVVRLWENNYFKVNRKSVPAPIFIIGAPRSGSTILYQALTNAYHFAYIDNTACTWHRNLRFGLWLSQKKYGDQPHDNFKAEHGSTRNYGGHAPSECGQFWYRWLPKDRHFVDHHEVTPEMVAEIRTEVLGVSAYLKRPLLFKNLNAGQRLRFIHKAFPNAKIIFVRRDPRFVTRSILRGREKVGKKEGQWWGIMPSNFKELLKLPERLMCVSQVYYLEKQIEEDLFLFPDQNIVQIHYQDLGDHLIHELGGWCGAKPRHNAKIPQFHKDSLQQLTELEEEELNRLVEQYPFKKELFA
jgi:hypothetical protein